MVLGLFKSSKKRKEDLKVKSLKKTANAPHKGGRVVNKKKSDARRELNKMGHLTDKQAAAKDKKDRIAYDKEHKIVNKRGRQTGTKEGYDPKKGVKNSKTSTLTNKKKKKKSRHTHVTTWRDLE
tara:strand:+ start:42 stop:413 length:372 start_codon:yes stop_codon:yes gene_type:complete